MNPSVNHSYLLKRIILAIEKTGQWEALPRLTIDIDSELIPDIAVYERGKIKPDFSEDKLRCDVLPSLVIEIASPSQTIHEVILKADMFVKAGISAVWSVEPYGKIIYVSTKQGRKVELAGLLKNEGLGIDFSEIFQMS